jgi:hypothetical protein
MSVITPSSNISKIRKKTKKKDKDGDRGTKHTIACAGSTDVGTKDEGASNTNRAYMPPEGTVLTGDDAEFGEFDYDAVKADEDAELWLVRVPDGVSSFVLSLTVSCRGALANRSK